MLTVQRASSTQLTSKMNFVTSNSVSECVRLIGDFTLDFFFGENVDVPTHQSCRKSNILPTRAQRQRELIFVNDGLHKTLFDIGYSDLINFRGCKRVGSKD